MSSAPVFVVGTPRSGTTLTARILGRHPDLFMAGENHFFEDVLARARELGDPAVDPAARDRISGRLLDVYGRYNQVADQERVEAQFRPGSQAWATLRKCASYGEFLRTFMELQAEASGCKRWGNNTPKDIFHCHEILRFFPNAVIIVCVRDIRDFLVSYGLRWTVTSEDHKERLRRLYHPVLTALLWRSTAQQLSKLRDVMPEARLCVVRYEDLVHEPEATVQQICIAAELTFSPNLLAVEADNSSLGHGGAGIFTRSVGSWRDRLPAADAWLAERIAGRNLTALGYERAAPFPGVAALSRAVATFPGAALRALHANRAHRGPLLQYLRRRLFAAGMHSQRLNRSKAGEADAP